MRVSDEGVSRRTFLGSAGAAVVLAAAVPGYSRLGAPPFEPYRALYDERFAAGWTFGLEAERRGWSVRAIRGDVTSVWFRELSPRWRQGPAPVTGVTTPQTLFVLERLAWDAGLRVTNRRPIAGTSMLRWIIGVPQAGERA